MLTLTNWKSLLRRFTGITVNEVNDYGIILLNDGRVKVLTAIDSYITEQIFTASTVASQQDYSLPIRCFKIEDISILVSTIRYTPKIITNVREWHRITSSNTSTSDIPLYVYVDKDKISFYPTPSANGNTIRAVVTLKEPDLIGEDATGGTISITNASSTVTGVGTNFLPTNVGWRIKLPDGIWYEVLSVASTTSLEIVKYYEGPTTTGATYILGQTSVIPEEGQILPVYHAAMTIFLSQEKLEKAKVFEGLFVGSPIRHDGLAGLLATYSNKTEGELTTGRENTVRVKDRNDYPFIT